AARGVRERRVDLAEHEAGPRNAGGKIGERAPGQRRVRLAIEPKAPHQRRAVDHRQPRVYRAEDVTLENAQRLLVPSAMQLEHREMPREMAVKRCARIVFGEPALEKRGAAVVVEQLEVDVREVVAGVGVSRELLERALRQSTRLLEAIDLVIGEGERGLKPPVVAVCRGQPLQEVDTLLLAIGCAREPDGAARLVYEQRVARKLPHVL